MANLSKSIVAAVVASYGSSAFADLSYWPPEYTVDRVQCDGAAARVTITVRGTWFCPAVPTGMHAAVDGARVIITVEWEFIAPPPCAAVQTPWSYQTMISGLTEGATYQTAAVFRGPLNPAPAALGSFTVDCACIADLDDGSGRGHPDGGVGIEDLVYYLAAYEAGTARADVDDGTGTGTPDGGVGIEDLLYFMRRYAAGC